ncbi:MFS transporter [Anaeromyxobacter diazotrophicus]|uniref:MFS transporter n=1 Tax=Anaeromyxobacter diazotrophicus TaxID=2590199 RepID=A0A7I9VRT8_9BACT|nr:MFS transporter [Anaeromyxobacter diazotrophicus]GEJ58779.1 MFS transporter [Anaeromyxobacter diazotrophicus]
MDGPAPPPAARSRWGVVLALGTSQTLAWASSYYLPAILADPIAASLGIRRTWVFGAFSMSLLICALLAPRVGRFIDRRGGRGVLALSAIVLAAGLLALAAARGPAMLFAAWAVLGAGMALGLYDAAFATLTTIYGAGARGPITGITLLAGFASTVSWPLSSALEHAIGWRATCAVWAGLNLALSLPLLRVALPAPARLAHLRRAASARVGWTPRREMLLLAYAFAATWFVTGAMVAHLPRLLERAGATTAQAIAAAALMGPAQVGARVAEFLVLRRAHPLASARVATTLHPLGAAALGLAGTAAIAPFAILYGAGNGLLTIARGTVPLAVFGAEGYGERTGLLNAPARAVQALAPFAFGLLVEPLGVSALYVSAGLCLSALVALGFVQSAPARPRTSGA